MDWQIIVAIAVAIPVILFPAALIWYFNASGILTVIKDLRKKKVAQKRKIRVKG